MKAKLLKLLPAVALVGLAIYCYRDYQRGAVERYMNSEQFHSLLAVLPTNAPNQRCSIVLDNADQKVTIRVEAKTKEEFDKIMEAGKRLGRPNAERLVIVWEGVNYTFN